MLSKRKKLRQEKRKQRGGEKAKSKSQDACGCVTCKSNILLSGSEGRKVYELLMALW